MGRGLVVSPSPPPPIPLAVGFVVVIERLLPHIPPLLLLTVFLFSPPPQVLCSFASSSLSFSFLTSFFVVFVVFSPRANRGVVYMHVLEKKSDSVDSSRRVSDVSNTCGGGEFDGCGGGLERFLMTPWMACQNLPCYKNRAALAQASNQTRENFAAVPTRTSYAPICVQSQKMQSIR